MSPETLPRRIQRSRTKSWRKPEDAIIVSRPSKWGNPHRVTGAHTVIDRWGNEHDCEPGAARGVAVRLYREDLASGRLDDGIDNVTARDELRGHDLVCWCPLTEPCHADVLLEVANA